MQLTETIFSDSTIFIEKKRVENRLWRKSAFCGEKGKNAGEKNTSRTDVPGRTGISATLSDVAAAASPPSLDCSLARAVPRRAVRGGAELSKFSCQYANDGKSLLAKYFYIRGYQTAKFNLMQIFFALMQK